MHVLYNLYERTRRVLIIYRARFLANSFFSGEVREKNCKNRAHEISICKYIRKCENSILKKLHNKSLITDDLSLNYVWTIMRFAPHEYEIFSWKFCSQLANQKWFVQVRKKHVNYVLCHEDTTNKCYEKNVASTTSKDDSMWFVSVITLNEFHIKSKQWTRKNSFHHVKRIWANQKKFV